jgi:hypothetical protein
MMKTVISHFYNEEFLLPYWLKHHTKLFDYGIMINHNSTDSSVDIIRKYAPHWRIVNTANLYFNAFLTDLEVMNFENEIPGWKIALNTTEFLVCATRLDEIIQYLNNSDKQGVSCNGHIIVDNVNSRALNPNESIITQIHWGFNDNIDIPVADRMNMNLGCSFPSRNRFFHKLPVGMYQQGRHQSYHPDSQLRLKELMVWHFAYAPWNEQVISRKLAIKHKLDPEDVKRGAGRQHTRSRAELEDARIQALSISHDLSESTVVKQALNMIS